MPKRLRPPKRRATWAQELVVADPLDSPEAAALRGTRILWARELVEPNRYAFARHMGVDASTIRKIEDGTRASSIGFLARLCHTLRIDLDYVVSGRLSGVDRELRQLLVRYHPQLALDQVPAKPPAAPEPAPPRRGTARKGRAHNTPAAPTIPAA